MTDKDTLAALGEPVAWMMETDDERWLASDREDPNVIGVPFTETALYTADQLAALQARVEALEGENARLRKANELRMEETHKERDEAKLWFEKAQEWKQENARLSDDAARYCWLRDHSVPPHNFYIAVPDEFGGVKYSSREVDAYIDEARAALEVGGGDVG